MNNRWWLVVVGLAVAGIIAVACFYPTAMLAPGALSAGHRTLGEDCFACHQPWRGATVVRCLSCHRIAEIGLRDTQHRPLAIRARAASFHQHLLEKNCLTCHSAHAGSRSSLPEKTFTHALLAPRVGTRCNTCHQAPNDGIHPDFQGQCSTCHQQQRWRPATFDHTRWFPLTGDHAATCDTCHQHIRAPEASGTVITAGTKPTHNSNLVQQRDFKTYTCYGCHEHRPTRIRAEHAEEGIRDLNNCVRCHRNGREQGEGREGSEDD